MGRQRHTVDGFRTVCWFHCLRIASGAKTTYQMDVLAEAPLMLVSDTPVDRKNKWRSYREGKHTPNDALVEAIEARFPGSRAVLNHPVWRVLRLDRPLHDAIPGVLVQLPPQLYAVVRGDGAAADGSSMSPSGWNGQRLRRLEREVGFNALACLVALLRLSAESGTSRPSFVFGRAICRVLLLMGPWLLAHGIAQSVADYVERWVLPMATHDGQRPSFGKLGFPRAARRLSVVAGVVEANENKLLTAGRRADLRLDLLDDKFTLELSGLVGTAPMFGSDATKGPSQSAD